MRKKRGMQQAHHPHLNHLSAPNFRRTAPASSMFVTASFSPDSNPEPLNTRAFKVSLKESMSPSCPIFDKIACLSSGREAWQS
mmetsp:Transcript_105495/g.293744  ORF Transcript_105495/g.293744 Transcript_105495/m.293744 type:complete len:83 (+) Transcript_105495:168-416(+)